MLLGPRESEDKLQEEVVMQWKYIFLISTANISFLFLHQIVFQTVYIQLYY